MEASQIETRLKELSPEIPWAHLIELAPGRFSVTPAEEKFYKKATGLSLIGELLMEIAEMQVRGHSLAGKRVLDLACGSGAIGLAVSTSPCGVAVTARSKSRNGS